MNRALLRELLEQAAYPSITLLHPTEPGLVMHPDDVTALIHLAHEADGRLEGDVPDDVRLALTASLVELIERASGEPSTTAIAICVSPISATVVRLGREVRSRCVIDETFATRDMVADANRTAVFRVLTVSDHVARVFVGDRNRLAEEHTDRWPLIRDTDQSLAQWSRAVAHAVRAEHDASPLPTVVAGVERSMREILKLDRIGPIGVLSGNHDRTHWPDLHRSAWPIVEDWLRQDRARAMDRLEVARGARRYAGGLEEVWELARDGRVQLLVVEDEFEVPVRLLDGQLQRADDATAPDVIDDAVDELIELVLLKGGDAVIVPAGDLAEHEHLAAVLRY